MDFCLSLATSEILKEIKEDTKKNLAFSPFTTNCMLNLVASGSEGEALRQWLHFLGSPNIDDLNTRSSRMIALATVDTVAEDDSGENQVATIVEDENSGNNQVPEGPVRMSFGEGNDLVSERTTFGRGNYPCWTIGKGCNPSRENTTAFGIGIDPSRDKNAFGIGNDPSRERTNAFGVGTDPSRDRTAFGVGINPSRDRTNAFGVGTDPSQDRTAFGVGINPSREETTNAFGVGNNPVWGWAAFGIRNDPFRERATPFGMVNDPSRERTALFGIGNDPSQERTALFGIGNNPSRERTAAFGIGNDPPRERTAGPFLERPPAFGIGNDPYRERTAFGIGNDRLWERTTGTRNGHYPPRDEKGVSLTFAGGIWIDCQYPLKPSFQKTAKEVYRAEAKAVNFKTQAKQVEKEINLWAETETEGLIRELIAPGLLCGKPEPAIVLANALYFKGAWDDPFKPSLFDMNFHLLDGGIIRVPFLSGNDRYEYYGSFETFKVLRLPYARGNDLNKQFSMSIFLPNRSNGLHDMIQEVNSDPGLFHKHMMLEKVKLASLRIPKFKFSNTFIVSETMQKHGLTLPFQLGGGPMGMVDWEMVDCPNPDKLMISLIIQKSFIEVNEEGTEAAACDATVLSLGCSAAPRPNPLHFDADYPFMFMIKEDMSDTVFFTGVVLNPLAQN
ncbi:hypothetical protein Tsubulata_001435 [Turnera subulata]|uniref:Serpin domain-containing protein n=1 Tax=Turnera subulata TaxID=218843 RepID=A0A9Q0J4P8_9ROSI|nr:hypothetical protein Tsubulata_001435 [Turnera subulata]